MQSDRAAAVNQFLGTQPWGPYFELEAASCKALSRKACPSL